MPRSRPRAHELPPIGDAEFNQFTSNNVTGTGSAVSTAHGLGRIPSSVFVIVTGGNNGAGAAGTQFPVITEGSHTSSSVIVTCTAGSTYKILAF